MKNNKFLLIMLLGLFLISFASAIQDCTMLGTFKSGTEINLSQICDTCSYVTLDSIMYPNSSKLYIDVNMTKNGRMYDYPFYIETNGDYFYYVAGDKDGTLATETFCFEVNPSGKLGVLIFLGVLAFLFVGLGIGLKIPPLGFIGSILLILAGMYAMIYGLCDVANLYTRGIAISLLGLGIIFMFSSAYEWFISNEEE